MTRLRSLWEELVDRRLWPVALVLVLALIAVPVFLAKPAPEGALSLAPAPAPAVAPAPAAAPPPPGSAAAVSDVTGLAYVGPVEGAAKDPFRPRGGVRGPAPSTGSVASAAAGAIATPAASSGSAAGFPASGGGSSSSAGSGSTGSSRSGGGSVSGSGSTRTTPAPSTGRPIPGVRPTAVAALEFGLLGGRAIDRRVAELTPLPSPLSPAVVYLGQSRAGESVFLISSDARATRGGRCEPDRRTCSYLHLRPGQVAYLTVDTTAGRSVRYRLKYVRRLPG